MRAYHKISVHPVIQKLQIATLWSFRIAFHVLWLRNAVQTFQRFMEEIVKDLDFYFDYLDHMLVSSRSPQELDQPSSLNPNLRYPANPSK